MGEMIEVINPARFEEVVGWAPVSSDTEIDSVIASAHASYQSWSQTAPELRARMLVHAAAALRQALPELIPLYVRENGKPLGEAERDLQRSIELLELVATDLPAWWKPELIDHAQPVWARRRARGVTVVISPWNSPVLLSFKRLVPALAAGNTVIVKPAEQCPLTILRCIEILNSCLPNGILAAVAGSGALAGEKLVADDRVRTVAFTGSTRTGRRVMEVAARTVKKVFLELGGNDAAIVLADAVLDDAAIRRMSNAILRASGQVCIAIKRVYVHHSRFNELVEKLQASFEQTVVGDGLAPETTMGPLNNKMQFDFVTSLIGRCRRDGLTVLTKGRKLSPDTWDNGFFMLPSIILDAKQEHELVQCEQFGPVIPILPFYSDDEAVKRANDTEYGLRASVWTANMERAQTLADGLESGAVFFNNHGIFQDLHIEFPGIKQSGFSRYSRWAAMDHYTDIYGFAS
jgi:acyl-CoA reductase-like NAD-dependent aldehyde dehydrogenase